MENEELKATEKEFLQRMHKTAVEHNRIAPELYEKYNVKRGLRNADGSGVLVGLTEIGDVHGYVVSEHETKPVAGELRYRGIEIKDLVSGFQKEKRHGFEETAFLLLFGKLPTKEELKSFTDILASKRTLPLGFKENMILKNPSRDLMNQLARSVLILYSFDEQAEDRALPTVIRQCIDLIARFPTIIAYSYQAKQHYHGDKSLHLHQPVEALSTAESFLHLIRPDSQYTKLEADLLDIALVLHAEHGGGNNSTFATHLVASSDTDTYSAIAAAVGSLKGRKHGGANIEVIEMMSDIKKHVKDWTSEKQVAAYIKKIINKNAFDRTGLVYGMGHAVYTISDPREEILREHAKKLAKEKGRSEEFELYRLVQTLTPMLFAEIKKSKKSIACNVDFYSGFVYSMLGIPGDLFTPIFAISRISGWAAHLIEEHVSGGRIMRPAYKYVGGSKQFIPMSKRIPVEA
ncbi:MAG: citrate/2-methylcitrate synthase [Spirochaetes bacterium]|nr:citrate/2-methylcitrate synthase [Spirochaetota bacterium]